MLSRWEHKWKILFIMVLMTMMNGCACSHPESEEMYVNNRHTDGYGQYVFEMDLSEPLCSYDVEIGACLSCDDREYVSFDHLPLHVLWQSPTDSLYEETVYLDRDDQIGGDFHTKNFFSPYRVDMIPKERGIWNLKISVPDTCKFKSGLNGIGLRLVQKK